MQPHPLILHPVDVKSQWSSKFTALKETELIEGACGKTARHSIILPALIRENDFTLLRNVERPMEAEEYW